MPQKIIIHNPGSGSGDNGKTVRRRADELGYTLEQTETAGDAVTLAAEAAEAGFSTVVAAGGDGTVNEVVQGIDHPDVQEAVETIRSTSVDAGVPVGGLGLGIDDVIEKATNGYQMLNLESTTGALQQTVTGWFDTYEGERSTGE